jgi:hypothetical protein
MNVASSDGGTSATKLQPELQQHHSAAKRTAAAAANALIRRKVLTNMVAGVGVLAVPVMAWWWWARRERQAILDEYKSRMKLPASSAAIMDTYDYIISEKIQAGDILLFDRRCERCAASPWAALACFVSKNCLAVPSNIMGDNHGAAAAAALNRYDHVGLVVPGYVNKRSDAWDPTNLLLMEATPSGIVARPLKERLEQSASQSILLLQLACPGEQRSSPAASSSSNNKGGTDSTSSNTTTTSLSSSSTVASVERTRSHVERELQRFRDAWLRASVAQHYSAIHSTVTLGGALAYRALLLGASSSSSSSHATAQQLASLGHKNSTLVIHPASYLVVSGLQAAAAAPSLSDVESRAVKPGDFLRDYRLTEEHVVRLRPGWRFLPPIPLKQSSSYASR